MTSLNIKEWNKDKNNYDIVSNEWAIKNNIAMVTCEECGLGDCALAYVFK